MINPAILYEILAAIYCLCGIIAMVNQLRSMAMVFVPLAIYGFVKSWQLNKRPPMFDMNIGPIYIDNDALKERYAATNDSQPDDHPGQDPPGA